MAEVLSLIHRRMLRPFAWGGADCLLSVADVLVGLGLPDPAARYRGRYRTALQARRLIGRSLLRSVRRDCKRLGWPEIAPETAEDGDVGVVGKSLAVRADGGWFVKTERGYGRRERARRAWSTGWQQQRP